MKYTGILFCCCAIFFGCQSNDKKSNEDQAKGSTTSEITCPKCGHKETEELPTTSCLISYDCKKCGETLVPEGEDCCVFCTHGTHKCPSIQEKE